MRLFIFIIGGLLLFSLIWFWQGIYLPPLGSAWAKTFVIEKGQGLNDIASQLEKIGLLKSKYLFEFYAIMKGKHRKIQAGTYTLRANQNMAELLDVLSRGEIVQMKLTIIEGWNLRDIGWYFENKGMFQAEELFEIVGFPMVDYSKDTGLAEPEDFSRDYTFLQDKPKNVTLEGYLFPDTYLIDSSHGLEEIIKKMLGNFDRRLTSDLREEIAKQGKSIFEIITMASLLEKEVWKKEDKELVSGILWKRLENNMPLQVDATITYITGKKTTKISREETEIDSPYNAYKYQGLPLGPICNPGLDSIKAAIYPKNSDFWYYLSTPEGQTIFSRTLEEHNVAKAKYLR